MALGERYKSRYRGWNVQHFHSWYSREGGKRSYTWIKNTLQKQGLVTKSKKKGSHRQRRDRSPLPGMMIHQDGSDHEWVLGKKWNCLLYTSDAADDLLSLIHISEPTRLG